MKAQDTFDHFDTLATYLLCGGDAAAPEHMLFDDGTIATNVPAKSKILGFSSMRPRKTYTADASRGRMYAADPGLLLSPIQDIFGNSAEVALFDGDKLKWFGFRKVNRRPKGLWVAKVGADVFEVHYRIIFPTGRAGYHISHVAIDSKGRRVPSVVQGDRKPWGEVEFMTVVSAASIIEDAHRPGAILATVFDASQIVFPVAIGDHKDLFSIRDAPLTPEGKRRAIMHWVSAHVRKRQDDKTSPVKAHWRGIRTLEVGTIRVTLEPNPCA